MSNSEIDAAMETASKNISEHKPAKDTSVHTDADKFKEFVKEAKAFVKMDNKIYLTAEAWQYIINLKNLNAEFITTEEKKDNKLTVYCQCTLKTQEGNIVSSGMMLASSDEVWLKDKAEFAVYGMAQTRALSRAVRNKYAYIAKVCGFEAVPLDEMPRTNKII